MDGVKKDAIVYVFTKAGRCICGRYVGEREENVRIVLQRKVIPDDKLLGKGVHDRTLIRCSKDIGEPIDIPIAEIKVWSYARYNEICFVGEPEEKEYFWPFFHFYDSRYLNIENSVITQYNSAGYFKGREKEPRLEE
jgi:hypothetical protein